MKHADISPVDTMFTNGCYPIEFLFYYPQRIPTGYVRKSLKQVHSLFWPLFGEYRDGRICFERYKEEDIFNELHPLQEFDPRETQENLYRQVHHVNPANPKKLFYMTLLQFKNGTAMIPRMNHLAGDGYSYFYFLSVLAALSGKTMVPFRRGIIQLLSKPVHHRTVLKPFRLRSFELPTVPQIEKVTLEFIKIPRQEIHRWVTEAGSETTKTVSPNDLLCALALKKMVLRHEGENGNNYCLTIPMDVRREIKEYGIKYFGNALRFNTIPFDAATIENSSTGVLAAAIRKSMPILTREKYLAYLEELETQINNKQFEKLRPFDPEQGCLITNLSRMPAGKLDFGTGPPDLIFPLTVEKNSVAILADQENYILRFAY
jgi:hypothetical protein